MFCHKCGTQIPDDGIFCPQCGTQIKLPFIESSPRIPLQNETPKQTPFSLHATDSTYAPILSFTGLFNPNGRRARGKALGFGITLFILDIVLIYITLSNFIAPFFGIALATLCIYVYWINLIKRLHDINLSGYWTILYYGIGTLSTIFQNIVEQEPINFSSPLTYIPLILALIWLMASIFIFCKLGTNGYNQYGPDPLKNPTESMKVYKNN